MSSDPDATTTSPAHWSYVSEGGATIVFSYVGPRHPAFSRTVLRLRKTIIHPPPQPIFKPLDVAEEWERKREDELEEALGLPSDGEDSDEEMDDPTIEFQDRVTSLLIPPKHLPRLEPARVNKEWLEELSKITQDQRPAERRAKDMIDVGKTKAVLATDLVGGKGWAVEIKPKWAFLPNPAHLSKETRDVKAHHCRFCMHSYQKMKSGDTAAHGYCPLDLFSGKQDRVIGALESLWKAWIDSDGGVNNLKIFVGGKAIRPKEAPTVFAPELGLDEGTSLVDMLHPFSKAVLPLLLHTTLLPTLSTLQRTLDPIDIEGVSALWTLHPESHVNIKDAPVGFQASEPTIEEWVSFTHEYLKFYSGRDQDHGPLAEMGSDRLRFYCLAYLLSATFKDCSVILRMDAGDGRDTITAIDLDPKSVERLRKWEIQDRELVLGFKKALDKKEVVKKPCHDEKVQIKLPKLRGGRVGGQSKSTESCIIA